MRGRATRGVAKRERSLFASVELSLRRLPEEARKLCDRVERAARKGPTSAAGIESALRRDLSLLRRRFERARAERSGDPAADSRPADRQEES